jgi:ABC-type transport system involved in cytochrome c biogenesis ATPase subunit
MKFTFKNLGKLDEAEIEVKDLTIVCGENNTGKTYLLSAIYGFLSYLNNTVTNPVTMSIRIGNRKVPRLRDFLDDCLEQYKTSVIHRDFLASPANFKDFNLNLETELDFDQFVEKISLPFITTRERTGMVRFKEEIDFARRRLFDIASESKRFNQFEIFQQTLMDYKDTYPKPIQAEYEFIHNLQAYEKIKKKNGVKESEQSLLNMKQLEAIIGGVLELSSDGTIYFKPYENKSLKLSMDQVSSSIRSIVSLYFYIRDQSHKENQILMIDEPEMNLHPKNQRAMARFIASLVNQGIKVMVSTHSDYLVRELNHLTALHKFKDQDSVKTYLASEDNPYSEEVLISNEKVGLYFTKVTGKKVKLHQAPISEYGTFTVASFDNEIESQQQAENNILRAIHGRNRDED